MTTNIAEGDIDHLVRGRFFPGQADGVMVEVGAARPDFLSLGALYRSLGWTVLSIEPNPEFCELHRARGHHVLQYACGDHDQDQVDFTVVDSKGKPQDGGNISFESYSSLSLKQSYARAMSADLEVRQIAVDLRRLDTILDQHAPNVSRIDLVAIDVEGWELEVLNGLTFDRFRPRVLIVENLFSDRSYRRSLADRGYALWQYIRPNDIYVRADELRPVERLRARAQIVHDRAFRVATAIRSRH